MPDDRLDSWKAIAAYLGRDVSTVRRWEKTEGLPVHRHRHAARGSAYAYKSELDRWFDSRRATFELPDQPLQEADDSAEGPRDDPASRAPAITPAVPSRSRGRVAWIAGAALVLAAVTLAVSTRTWPPASLRGFQASDWILIGDIENRTGDPRLDDTVRYALERELSESRFVNVVSQERVEDTFRLMKKPVGTRVDRAIGLEVCRRDGGIRALLTGRVEEFGGTYVVSTVIVDPNESGRTMAAADVRASDEAHILDAIHQLSTGIRGALGENLRAAHDPAMRLERVTTGSLHALQLYTQGIHAVDRREWQAAAELLQAAVDADPEFAAAQIYLAYCLHNVGRPPEEYLPHAREAARLAEHQTDREQYFILASYQQMTGELEKAVGLYETQLELYPDHYWAANNLHGLYDRFGRRAELWPLMDRLANARPNDFTTTVLAIQAALAAGVDLQQVDKLAAHARRLTADDPYTAGTVESVFLDFLPAFEAWLRNDVAATIRLAEETASRSSRHTKIAAMFEVALGRLAAAENLAAQEEGNSGSYCAGCGSDREGDLAVVAFFRGDRSALASHLAAAQQDYGRQLTLVVWLSLQADLQKGQRFFREWSAQPDDGHSAGADSAWAAGGRAELQLRHDERAALDALEQAVRIDDIRRPRYLRGFETLADALVARGDFAKAAAVLEEAARPGTRVFTAFGGESFGGVFWLRLRAKLARVYRRIGRVADADLIDAEVSKLLAHADPDFKILP